MYFMRRNVLQMQRATYRSAETGATDVLSQCLTCGALSWTGTEADAVDCRCSQVIEATRVAAQRRPEPSVV